MEAIGHLLSVVTQNSENLFAFLQAHGFLVLLVSGPMNSVECSMRKICISSFVWGLCTKEKLCLLQVVHSQYVYLCPSKVSSFLYSTFSNRNRKPIQCSFQWPWCVSIYKLAKQSASFIESISLCAHLWSLSYLPNWGHYIGHKSINPILSCMEMCACLYCYFVYYCLSVLKYWFILECIEFKPLFMPLPWFRNIIFKTSIPNWKHYTEFNVLDLKFRSLIRDKCHLFC